MLFGLADQRELQFQRSHDFGGVINAQRRLCHDSQMGRIGDVQMRHITDRFDQKDAIAQLAHRALDFRVSLVADHDELIALAMKLGDFDMHFGDQRAGRIENMEPARNCLVTDSLADPMGTEHQCCASRNFGEVLDEDRAARFQVVDHIGVVDDLMAYVDRCAKFCQSPLDNLDRAVDAGTKPAGLGQHHFMRLDQQLAGAHHITPIT